MIGACVRRFKLMAKQFVKQFFARPDFSIICRLMIYVGILFLPILFRVIVISPGDYSAHMGIAERLWSTKSITIPHFLYHVVALVIEKPLQICMAGQLGSWVTPSRLMRLSHLFTALLFYEMLALVLYFSAVRAQALTGMKKSAREGSLIALVLSLMLVMPIPLFMWFDHLLYIGYIGINVYHNPTIVALKPFAVLTFYYAANAFTCTSKASLGTIAGAATVTVLSSLAKPSYLICLLPALVVYVIYQYLRHNKPDMRLLGAGIFVPAIFVLLAQFLITYGDSKGGILFAPFQVMGMRSDYLTEKFLLSIAFPLVTYLCFFQDARQNRRLNLCWLVFFFGTAFTYLLMEESRASAGNFAWSGQICLFLLFVESTFFLLGRMSPPGENNREKDAGKDGKNNFLRRNSPLTVCLVFYAMHVLSGMNYMIHMLITFHKQFFW
jgi:hypothetical protein